MRTHTPLMVSKPLINAPEKHLWKAEAHLTVKSTAVVFNKANWLALKAFPIEYAGAGPCHCVEKLLMHGMETLPALSFLPFSSYDCQITNLAPVHGSQAALGSQVVLFMPAWLLFDV